MNTWMYPSAVAPPPLTNQKLKRRLLAVTMTTMHDDDGTEYDDDDNDGDNDDHDIYGYDELFLTSITAGWTSAVIWP